MKRIFVLLLSIVCCALGGVWAVPAKPIVKTLIQPDGSELKVRLVGDENGHYYITPEGNVVEQDKDGWYVVGNGQQREGERLQMPRKRVHSSTVDEQRRAPHQAERGLVILVEFSDVSFSKTRQNFDDLLNKEGYNYNGATGSARDYFRDASNGQYVPEFDVYGPYRLDSVMSYYGQNDRSGLDMHPDQMVVDAVAKLASDSLVDINFADYDTDNDGYMDNLFVYYAGYGENEGAPENSVWPHAWEVYEEYVKGQLVYDGKQIKGYACTSELQGTSGVLMCGIGTFCHEFGHVLGLPDFYVTDYSSQHKTLGDWDIMDAGAYLNGGNTPPTYSAHERFYLGWLT
ncbi:MAG: M6 family metalloprotease domain-containing protein, partial [Paludibacteraceae bacterium]|nr:M6 family metalloprotease domain-containing protein [Paludibacteraceae bacterium]